jgi:hypothetical protein
MKKITIINQNKGGVGKSFLTALILEKERKAGTNFVIIDIDSGNRSTSKRFLESDIYSKFVSELSLLKSDTIEKGLFNDFFQKMAISPVDTFYLDLGGNESREILSLFNALGIENVISFFNANNLDVSFMTVIRNNDRDCIDHFKNVHETIGNHLKHICMLNSNSFDNKNAEDTIALETTCKNLNISLRTFGKGPTGHVESTISDYVRSGFTSSLGMFAGVFVGMVEQLDLD